MNANRASGPAPRQASRGRRQRGAVLVVSLVFLALLTLIGVTAYSVATQEERMAGNARDRLRAFEAAEAALRDCERHLAQPALPEFSDDGALDAGMYNAPTGAEDKWQEMELEVQVDGEKKKNWYVLNVRQVGGVPGVYEQPRCIVQRSGSATLGSTSLRAELPQSSAEAFAYQITARGVGANRNTVVLLQSTFIRD